MGYEVKYIYHERGDDGKYNYEEKKEMSKRIGTAHEDVPLEKLAGAIMSQMARREYLVVDVEVYEYTKKKLVFKENKNGVVIKGKLFTFDGQEIVEDPTLCGDPADVAQLPPPVQHFTPPHQNHQQVIHQPHHQQQREFNQQPPNLGGRVNLAEQQYFKTHKPLRFEVYNPEPHLAPLAKKRRLPFTLGKKYPIYEERMIPLPGNIPGVSYVTVDDNNNKTVLADGHFVQQQQLQNDYGEFAEDATQPMRVARKDIKLSFDGEVADQGFNIRSVR
jgi:hypothetical protein